MKRSATRAGMTLVEIIVVLSLMAIISAVAVPSFLSLSATNTHSTGERTVRALLSRVRATALERGHSTTVTIDPATGRYWLDAPDTTDVLTLPETAALSSDRPRVHFRFTPSGEASSEPLFVTEDGKTTTIAVNRFTGAIAGDGR